MKLRLLIAAAVLVGVFVAGRLYRAFKQAARVLKPKQSRPPERTVEREGSVVRIRWGKR